MDFGHGTGGHLQIVTTAIITPITWDNMVMTVLSVDRQVPMDQAVIIQGRIAHVAVPPRVDRVVEVVAAEINNGD